MAQKYHDLRIWQRSMQLVTHVYSCSKAFPREEIYGLTNQIRRAAVSVPLNIAEGAGCDSQKEFKHFLSIARRSLYEVMTALELAAQLQFVPVHTIQPLLDESDQIAGMIAGLISRIETHPQVKSIHELEVVYETDD